MNIALFGFMGVGKSAVGRALAERLGLDFVDLDDEVVRSAGKTIPEIFSEGGEEAFRRIEREAARSAAAGDGRVIACGGGTVLDEENLRRLRGGSVLVLLTADEGVILRRVEADGEARPLLNVEGRPERLRSLLEARLPKYEEAADIVVDTSGKTPEQVAEEVVRKVEEAVGDDCEDR